MLCTAADIKPGDRVMVILPTIPEYWLMQTACLRTGTMDPFFTSGATKNFDQRQLTF